MPEVILLKNRYPLIILRSDSNVNDNFTKLQIIILEKKKKVSINIFTLYITINLCMIG